MMSLAHCDVFRQHKSHPNPSALGFLLAGARSSEAPRWQARGSGAKEGSRMCPPPPPPGPAHSIATLEYHRGPVTPETNTGNQKPAPSRSGLHFFLPRSSGAIVAAATRYTTFSQKYQAAFFSPKTEIRWGLRGLISKSGQEQTHTLPGCCKCPQNKHCKSWEFS